MTQRNVSPAWKGGLLVGLLAFGAAAKIPAAPPVSQVDCNGEICGFNVTVDALAIAPCQGRAVLVAYSRRNGATLVQCSGPGGSEHNMVYVFERNSGNGPVYEVEGGRYVNLTVLTQAATEGIPDRFGPVPLCSPPGVVQAGELTLVVKEPSGGEHPYCYRLYRATRASGTLAVTVEGVSAPTPSTDAKARWSKLVAGLLPYIAPTVGH